MDLRQVARDTRGLTGAELERLMNEAALCAVRESKPQVEMSMVYFSIDKLEHGGSRSPMPPEYEANEILAAHEAGKALITELLRSRGNASLAAVERISIVPRVRSKSRTIFLSQYDEAHRVSSKAELEARIQILLAGRAAQHLVLGAPTTYAFNDMAKAMDAALVLVNSGLTDVGVLPETFKRNLFYDKATEELEENPQIKLDDETSLDLVADLLPSWSPNGHLFTAPSEASKTLMEKESLQIVWGFYEENIRVLKENRPKFKKLIDLLIADGQVLGDDIRKLVAEGEAMPLGR